MQWLKKRGRWSPTLNADTVRDIFPNVNRFKIVVSDLHLGRGAEKPDGGMNPMEDFFSDEKFSELLGHYMESHPDMDFELIMNGDIFNMIWPDDGASAPDEITEADALRTITEIFAGHPVVIGALRGFCSQRKHKLVFLIGNHDQGLMWPTVDRFVKENIPGDVRIVHRYDFDGIYIEHGHQNEFLQHFSHKYIGVDSYDGGDSIQNLPWGSYFTINFLNPLKVQMPYIDKVKPFSVFLKWSFIFDTLFAFKVLARMVRFYLHNRFHPDPIRRVKFSFSVDHLREALLHNSIERAARRILENTSYNTVIYGHTHQYLYRKFGAKEYFNSGTWTEMVSLELGKFGRMSRLVFLTIEYPEGKPKIRMKFWRGSFRMEEDATI
jgi:UDP-2,3-diacylglucosamine pyrophosphatase LpxH